MGEDSVPAPGSMAAAQLGCTCAVLDNSYGHGAYVNEVGEIQYWVNERCSLHGGGPKETRSGREEG